MERRSQIPWLIALGFILVGITTSAEAQIIAFYGAKLVGEEVVPPSASSGYAEVLTHFESSGDCSEGEEAMEVCVQIAPGLSGPPIELRLHSGAVGENGPLEAILISFEGDDQPGCVWVTDTWPSCEQWREELLYVVLTTETYPDGALRAQLILEPVRPTLESSWGVVKQNWAQRLLRNGSE